MKTLLISTYLLLCVCACTVVEPWQRALLAKPEMSLNHPVDTTFDEHIYFSKEASSGGQSFSGGGCGCN